MELRKIALGYEKKKGWIMKEKAGKLKKERYGEG